MTERPTHSDPEADAVAALRQVEAAIRESGVPSQAAELQFSHRPAQHPNDHMRPCFYVAHARWPGEFNVYAQRVVPGTWDGVGRSDEPAETRLMVWWTRPLYGNGLRRTAGGRGDTVEAG